MVLSIREQLRPSKFFDRPMRRLLLLMLAYLGIAHYVVGFGLTLFLAYAVSMWTYFFVFLLPYAGLMGFFVAAEVLAQKRRLGPSVMIFSLGVVLSMGMFAYDFTHVRYQISGGGSGPTYTIWWWYYEPYWYGYRPGNV